jgi:hypothetical protein
MRFIALSTLTIALSTLAIAVPSNTIPKDYYLKNFAPIQLQRLSDFTNAHKDTLTAAQIALLSNAATAVSTFDTASSEALRSEVEALFSPADAKFILSGKTTATMTRREESNLFGKRSNDCECSTESDLCGTDCVADENNCGFWDAGCGVFWLYACDGLCY